MQQAVAKLGIGTIDWRSTAAPIDLTQDSHRHAAAAAAFFTRPPMVASMLAGVLCLASSAALADMSFSLPDAQLEPVAWDALEGWNTDDHLAAFKAYRTSCEPLRKSFPSPDKGALHDALWRVCGTLPAALPEDANAARAFFETSFVPLRISRLGENEGFLTGYFEPVVEGSRFPSPEFHVPLYRRPADLIAAGQASGSVPFPNKGALIGRRAAENQIVPYHERGAIAAGALDGQKLEICWLKDEFDALSIQIQGSARVILEDGTPLRINYDSHNGHPYTAVGRVLIERNVIAREEMSMERIREWMAAHPEEASDVRAHNRSYVFFRITGLSNEGEPIGDQGVPLTPGRSIAVDRMHEYGVPFFIEAVLPSDSAKALSPFRRLMIAQDTGSAIVGPARADIYWGTGDDAGRTAGRIRHPGHFVMLLPRELDPVTAGRLLPLPLPKPQIPDAAVSESSSKDGKSSGWRDRR
jgi:membrane-bound lytic murein transglycosylase A